MRIESFTGHGWRDPTPVGPVQVPEKPGTARKQPARIVNHHRTCFDLIKVNAAGLTGESLAVEFAKSSGGTAHEQFAAGVFGERNNGSGQQAVGYRKRGEFSAFKIRHFSIQFGKPKAALSIDKQADNAVPQ